jgi:hypothetical protein
VIAAGLLAVGGFLAIRSATARPAVAIAPSAVDFGPVAERASRVVAIRNLGRAPLQILAVSTSCGCTTAAAETSRVAPGNSTRLVITFDPVGHGPEEGPARHAVYLRTDDPARPELEVEVRAIVVKGQNR